MFNTEEKEMSAKFIVSVVLLVVTFFNFTHQDLTKLEKHLFEYGFTNSAHVEAANLEEGLKKFQNAHGIPETGKNDEETQKKLLLPRCGRPEGVAAPARRSDKWKEGHITYKLYNSTEQLTREQIETILDKLFHTWTVNVNLVISKCNSSKPDIEIYFTTQDDVSGILGYAFFPPIGDIFFDVDEDWSLGMNENQTYFQWVAAHEMGHALGLGHTEIKDSIMFPYYTPGIIGPSTNDLNHLRDLYGEAILKNEFICSENSVDALLNSNDRIIIQGKYYWKMVEKQIFSGPFRLDSLFLDLPERIDASLSVGTNTYFFVNHTFYRYTRGKNKPKIKLISIGFESLPTNIDAAFYDAPSKTIYFFKGSKYYLFHIKEPIGNRFVMGENSISEDWKGLPNDIDAAESLNDGNILFIKGGRCYVVKKASKEVVQDEECKSANYKC